MVADWGITIDDEFVDNFDYEINGNILKIKCDYVPEMMGTFIRVEAYVDEYGCSAELPIKVVTAI